MTERTLEIAQHEAAHVVVGVALGLRLRAAVVGLHRDREVGWVHGFADFDKRAGTTEAYALMLAAGLYYEDARGPGGWYRARGDVRVLRAMGHRPKARIVTLAIAAGAILESRRAAWSAVTRALLERDLHGGDIERLVRGEAPEL